MKNFTQTRLLKAAVILAIISMAIVQDVFAQTVRTDDGKYYCHIESEDPAEVSISSVYWDAAYMLLDGEVKIDGKNYTVSSIGNKGSRYRSMITMELPNTIKSLGDSVFHYCSDLKTIYLSSSISSLGKHVFSRCNKLRSIVCPIENPSSVTMADEVFGGVEMDKCVLYVPNGKVEDYKNAEQWKRFTNIKNISDTVAVTAIRFNEKIKNVSLGKHSTLYYTIEPNNATNKAISLSSSDGLHCRIDDGFIHINPYKKGEYKVFIESGSHKDSCVVTVDSIPLEQIVFEQREKNYAVGDYFYLSVKPVPSNAYTPGEVKWTSSDSSIVDNEWGGRYFSVKALGSATITARLGDKTAEYKVNVLNVPLKGFKIEDWSKNRKETVGGSTGYIAVEFIPANASNKKYTITTLHDSSIIKKKNIHNDGVQFDVVGKGTETIILTTEEGGFKDTAYVTALEGIEDSQGIKYRITSDTDPLTVAVYGSYQGDLVIPETVTSNGKTYTVTGIDYIYEEWQSELTSIKIPNTVTTIGEYAFEGTYHCNTIDIPASVSEISKLAFSYWRDLKQINVSTDNPHYMSVNGVLFNKDKTTLMCYPSGKEGVDKYDIPTTVTTIDSVAFWNAQIKTINIHKDVVSIELGALSGKFENINVNSANPKYLSIDGVIFTKDKTKLIRYPKVNSRNSYTIPQGVVEIELDAFSYSSLISVSLPNGLKRIGEWAFSNCEQLCSINIPITVTHIDEYALDSEKLTVVSDIKDLSKLTLGANVFGWNNKTLIVPVGTLEAYETSVDWNRFDIIKEASEVVEPTGISLNRESLTIELGEELYLYNIRATVSPENTSYKNAGFSIDKTDIVYIREKYQEDRLVLVGRKEGKAKLIASTYNGKYKAICEVTVIDPSTPTPVESVSLNAIGKTMKVNDQFQLVATVEPSYADNKEVAWSSNKTSIATVGDNGLVKAVAEGEAIITVKTKDGNKTATCTITVSASAKAVTGVTLDATYKEIIVGETAQLIANIQPTDATNKTVTWSSSNESVATVDAEGNVTAIKTGNCTIVATTEDGAYTSTCLLNVLPVKVTGVSIAAEKTIKTGTSIVLSATVTPDNATNQLVSWYSENTTVATVNQSGKVTAVKVGEAVIVVTTYDGNKQAKCKVVVKDDAIAVTSVSLNESSIKLKIGEEFELKAKVTPDDASNKAVKWLSSASEIASVNDAGKVTAMKDGEATITVVTQDGGKTAICKVIVAAPIAVESVSLSETSKTLKEGEEFELKATITPEDAADATVTWTSSKPEVASVDAAGKVKALKEGETTVTVTTVDGGKTAMCKVTVSKDTGFGDIDNDSGISIYPSLVQSGFTVEFADAAFTSIILDVYTLSGSKVYSERIKTQKQYVDISDLHKGVYIVRIKSHTFKIVKE